MTDSTTTTDLDVRLEKHRVELTGYCYRMLGSSFEAEDAVQDTMVRAWRSYDKFEGRSSLRSWLYRIATNVCLDMLTAGNKRARPMDLTDSTPLAQAALSPRPDHTWLEPMPDARILPTVEDPAEAAVAKESVRLAFMAALQQLPPKQRAVLILREVLAWKASEVAELLGTTVASVNSALQRARATLAERDGHGAEATVSDPLDEEQQKLLDRYMAAFEGYDMTALTALLHEDAIMTMPPFDLWLTGHDDITGFMTTLGSACEGSRLVPVQVNGLPGFAQYKPDPDAGGYTPWAVQVLEISEGRLTGFHFFLDTKRWFPLFGLPLHLDALEAESDQVEEGV
ncbi:MULTISPECIES: sigma-70 family RNA polymerase sigma factor [unclassified Streptomyces]|uniref:sigma-70 family RNA polymerase sigma factor n=1 Tax=unclassified Streptomyces TaxID=2593676 RepID=UPI0022587E8C|nr:MULTISPECIES: sigma-70 family RNA polymerase sigma factor [unclassified Streptomyces]MCX5331810.1 sigma-70 family RNA polymerase sigma factor [Streptomyces sp. NBC_00140]MCX5361210.1 sigma-70 family RNA polymerase sigma factor [Streptomyces sp. NBC_00124]